MNPNDYVAVVAFDSEAMVFVRPQKSSARENINKDIDRIVSGGGNILPGLKEKEAHDILQGITATRKHVILLSDGEAPYDGITDLVKDMRKDKQTVSAVAVQGADETLLRMITTEGGGRLLKLTDLKTLSDVYVKDAKLAVK